jgi:hypothetical protein
MGIDLPHYPRVNGSSPALGTERENIEKAKCDIKVKNLFGIQYVYSQVLSTRLTAVINTRLFLKPSNANKE